MNEKQLKQVIRTTITRKFQELGQNKYKEYKVLNNVPALIPILVDLMTDKFSVFVKDIEWTAPKPATFRVVLENDQYFYLQDLTRSWVAEVEGKKYYLLNLSEEERATAAIARILKYAKPPAQENIDSTSVFDTGAEKETTQGFTADDLAGISSEPGVPGTEEEFEG